MEKKFARVTLFLFTFGMVSFTALESLAERGQKTDHDYPESAFGKAPAPVDLGVGKSYASKAAEDWDYSSDDADPPMWGKPNYAKASRSPAGLKVEEPVSRGAQSSTRAANHARGTQKLEEASANSMGTSSSSSSNSSSGIQEVSLIASDLGFFPKTFFVTRDIPVRLFVTGSSKNTLCMMMDSFGVKRQIKMKKIEEINFTATLPGQYRFYCPVNGMEGTMVVKDFFTRANEASSQAQVETEEDPTQNRLAVGKGSGTYRIRVENEESERAPASADETNKVSAQPKNLIE